MNIKKLVAGALLAAFIPVAAETSLAQDSVGGERQKSVPEADIIKYANKMHLAYIRSSSDITDNASRKGLENLAKVLNDRTAIEPAGVRALDAVNIERGDLALFPFVYWPVTRDTKPLSGEQLKKVRNYMRTGGVILFDIRTLDMTKSFAETLQQKVGDLGIGPLVPVARNTGLITTFYNLSNLPGGPVEVEAESTVNGRERISPVIASAGGWAFAWAGYTASKGSPEWEQSIRSGVNMIVYALTGNKRADRPEAVIETLKHK